MAPGGLSLLGDRILDVHECVLEEDGRIVAIALDALAAFKRNGLHHELGVGFRDGGV